MYQHNTYTCTYTDFIGPLLRYVTAHYITWSHNLYDKMFCNFYIRFGSYNAYVHKYPQLVMEFNEIYINRCYVRCTLGRSFTHIGDRQWVT